jgi:hypothetical protein
VIVSPARRVLFVHVQKTGGSTVEQVLKDSLPDAVDVRGLPGDRHARLAAVLRAHPDYRDHWTFGFVRNPWARLWSWYSMIQRRQRTAERGNERVRQRIARSKFWTAVLEETPDFESFVMSGPDRFPRLRVPQVDYLRAGDRTADFIGRTESFEADLAHACGHIGIPVPPAVPRSNSGPGDDWRAQFTPAMRQRVADLYAADLEAFGYEF